MLRIKRILWAPVALCVIPLMSACGSDESGPEFGTTGGTGGTGGTSAGGTGGTSAGGTGGTSTGGTGGTATGGTGGCVATTCAAENAECGSIDDGCGNTLDCGTCTAPDTCGSDNTCSCTATTCEDAGANCGTIDDGCGATLDCGECTLPETCGGGGTNLCGEEPCTATTCEDENAECGSISDGCSATLDCGTCTSPETCSAANVCECTPTTCAAENAECGSLDDGCGTTLDCGTCTSPETCGGGGTDNVCAVPCTATTCAAENADCGTIDDGCGTTLDCGTCTSPEVCGGGGTNLCGVPADWPVAGELVITELMYNPSNNPEDDYEWIEIHNPSATDTYNLAGCVLSESTRTHTIATSLSVPPGAFITLASSPNPDFTPDYDHDRDVFLVNTSSGSMTLTCGAVVVDAVDYATSGAWPSSTNGAAIALDPTHYDATDNDDGANWCLATSSYGATGNLGTPGATNDSCGCTPLTACPSPLDCGDLDDNCGGTINCGTCTSPETCGGEGTDNVCGQGACVPTTCADEGANCGTISDGCGVTLNCGTCTAPQTCAGGGTANVCGCTPTTCADESAECGTIDDGCGGTLDCGGCTTPQTCGGGGTDNVCGCTATTCAAEGAECDSISNGCGGTLDCGTCPGTETCTANVCGCTPTTCANESANCGSISDGCGGSLDCGTCTLPETCAGGGQVNICGCTPLTACPAGLDCDTIPDGCGGTVSCGTCTSPATCAGGGTANVCGLPQPGADQVIFTEVMQNPTTVDDPDGEWFEVHNTSSTAAFNLNGCVIEDDGTDSYTIATDLYIEPGAYLTFAYGSTVGFTPNHVYTGITLGNGDDELRLVCGATTIDEIKWDNGTTFPDPAGASMNLDPGSLDATSNDDGTNWCVATSPYNTDLGTPGAANDSCNPPPTYPIAWCRLQFPPSMISIVGDTRTVYGRVNVTGLSDQTTGTDTDANVIGQVGYGADTTDPTTWTDWTVAAANPSWVDTAEPNNDEYMATMTIPAASATHYDYAFRFSGDGGTTWTYCDLGAGSTDGYAPADAGDLLSKSAHTIDWCRLQSPTTIDETEGTAATVYGRVYIDGLTTLSTDGNDTHPLVVGQVGYGADGTAADATWTWSAASENASFDPTAAGEPNNDEYMATFNVPAASGSPYDYAFRFSGDGGTTWTYCDLGAGSTDGYAAADAGAMTSTGGSTPTVWINEIHYDNDGGDTGEGFEIAGVAGTDLAGWTVVLYNGSNGLLYGTENLTGIIDAETSGYGALWFPVAGIQNGGPDGLALVDATNTVVQFLSYEGTFTAADGPASGTASTDIVVAEISTTPIGESLQLTGAISSPTWTGPLTGTPDTLNVGQTF
jgi:Lamin Tail Domain